MSEIDPELVALAHTYFQEHILDTAAREPCVCLRPYPCANYPVRSGRLVLVSDG